MSGRHNTPLSGLRGTFATLALSVLFLGGSLVAVMIADAEIGSHASSHATAAKTHRRGHASGDAACASPSASELGTYGGYGGPPPPPSSGPCVTIEKLQRIGSGSFTKVELSANEGETVYYEIVVKNTGSTELMLSGFSDPKCTNVAGGASSLAPGASTTWTCEHKLTATGSYANVATIEASEGVREKRCHGWRHGKHSRCDSDKGHGHKLPCHKGRSLGKKESNTVVVNVPVVTTTTSTTSSKTTTTPITTTTSTTSSKTTTTPITTTTSTTSSKTSTTSSTTTSSTTTSSTTTSSTTTSSTTESTTTITPITSTTTSSITTTTVTPIVPDFTIEKLQKVGSGSFTKSEIDAKEGETVDYEIVVKNTGGVELELSNFEDSGCTNVTGGASSIPVSGSTTWECEHLLNTTGKYSNSASVEANEGVGKKDSNTVTVNAEALPKGACDPSSSLSALVIGSNVVSYFPQGSWDNNATTGIAVVNVEGTSVTKTVVPTTHAVNSCASNSVTEVTVCVANDGEIYVLKGTAITRTLTSGGTDTIGFSGGECTACGVAMDSVHNRALITISIEGSPGFQFLNLETLTFETPFKASSGEVSEDPLLDPGRNLILSPAENDDYELVNVAKPTEPEFFTNPFTFTDTELEFDSAAEDCSTGIALASLEFSDPSQIYIGDLTQAKFTPGSPGSWTAPSQIKTLEESELAAGSTGIAVAQGTHTGVTTGEFGGDSLTALALPETSGSGTPELRDYVSCEIGEGFEQGKDPHVVTAYQTPNGGDAIALFGNETGSVIVRVDLTKMLNESIVPRTVGGHKCASGTLPSEVETFINLGEPPQFTADTPPEMATTTATYSYTFAASGLPTPEFDVHSGTLPPGLSLNETTGELTGEPTEAGTFTFTIEAHNGQEPAAITPTLTIHVTT